MVMMWTAQKRKIVELMKQMFKKLIFIIMFMWSIISSVYGAVPVATSTPITIVNEDSEYSYTLSGSDGDGDALTWSVKEGTTLPSWLGLISTNEVSTFVGSGIAGSIDANGTDASLNRPWGITIDSGNNNIYIAEFSNHKIRKITPEGVVSTIAGSGMSGSTDATGTDASFNEPIGVAVDSSGNIYVADSFNHKIRKITQQGVVTTFAGSGNQGSTDANSTAASFGSPMGVAVDSSNNIYVADRNNNKIRKITPNGVVTTFVGSGTSGSDDGTGADASFNFPCGIAVDSSDNIYIGDYGNHKIRKVTPDGVVTTIAGNGTIGSTDANGTDASFDHPFGVAVDSGNNIYVADAYSHKIRMITPEGVVTTVAGGSTYGSTDGIGVNALFYHPIGVAVDSSDNIFVADSVNHKIRKITTAKLIGTPTNDNVGLHDVNLTLSDGDSNVSHDLQITVSNTNDAPTASNITFTIDEDTNKTFTADDFNFSDEDSGDSLNSIYITTLESSGSFKLNGTDVSQNQKILTANISNLIFVPEVNGNGIPYATFGFKVNDGESNSTSAYTATINVTAVNDTPIITIDSTMITDEDNSQALIFSLSDVEDGNLTLNIETNATYGTVTINDNNVSYTPILDYNGTDSFNVSITDSNGSKITKTINVTVNSINDTPTLASISNIIKDEDFSEFNVTIVPNDADKDNLKLTVDTNDTSILDIPVLSTDWISYSDYNGTIALAINAKENKYGSVELNVTIEDPSGTKSSELFVITVNPVDDKPIALNMAVSVGPNSKTTFDGYTPAFSDVDGDEAVKIKILSNPTYVYFQKTTDNWVSEGNLSAPFEVLISEFANYRFNAESNIGSFSDVNWSIMTDGDIDDATGWSNIATWVVTIIDSANNNAPDVNISTSDVSDLNNSILSINEDNKTEPIYLTFEDDYTPAGFLVNIAHSSDSSKVAQGDFNITKISDNNISVVITPKANVYGDINITLGVFDGDKNGTRTFTLRIVSVNDIPTAFSFEKVIDEDTLYSFSALDLTTVYSDTNDSSQDVNEIYPNLFQILTLPQHGQLDLNDSLDPLSGDANVSLSDVNNLIYRPSENNNSDVNFTWRAYDGEDWTDIKTAIFHINAVDDKPSLSSIADVVKQEDFVDFNITLSSNDIEGDHITYTIASSDSSIAIVAIVDGQIKVTPVSNAYGVVTIEVNATANGKTDSITFDINIADVNDDPTILTTFLDLNLYENFSDINLSVLVTDIDGDDLNISIESNNTSIIDINQTWGYDYLRQGDYSDTDQTFTILSKEDRHGMVKVDVKLIDENGASDASVFNVTVNPLNKLILSSGWNLVSLPVDTNITKSEFNAKFPNALLIWKYDNIWKYYSSSEQITNTLSNLGYGSIEAILKAEGFWIYNTAEELSFSGVSYAITTNSKLISANSGWHLLGNGSILSISDIITANPNINIIWSYGLGKWSAYSSDSIIQNSVNSDGYETLDTIYQGQGFWVNIK